MASQSGLLLLVALAAFIVHGTSGAGDESSSTNPTSTNPTTTPSTTPSTTTVTTPTPPSTYFPCVDTGNCVQAMQDSSYCAKNPFARTVCCNSCAMSLGFTATKKKKVYQNGAWTIVLYNVVDLSLPAAQKWATLPTVTIPGYEGWCNTMYTYYNGFGSNYACRWCKTGFNLITCASKCNPLYKNC